MPPAIQVESLSKRYRLGVIGGGTLREDANRWWASLRGRPDPTTKVGVDARDGQTGEEIWALRDVSFEVSEGEILGIIGRNGAGKSTLLKILSRITAPTSGRAVLRGRVGSLLEVGTGFHPELTGRENIYLNGTILGMTKAEVDRKLDEIVAFSEMAPFVDTPVKRYSSGMTVRLAFAVAAHLEPEILIVDEVLAVGDAAFQKKCIDRMGDFSRSGRTILFVSHNMQSIERLCTQVAVVDRGALLHVSSPGLAIAKYFELGSEVDTLRDWSPSSPESFGPLRRCRVASPGRPALVSGESAVFEFEFEPSSHHARLQVGVGIYNDKFVKVAHLDTLFQGLSFSGTGTLSCTIPRVPLVPGTYTLNVVIRDSTHVVSHYERFVRFDVVDGVFYRGGHSGVDDRAAVNIEHRWEWSRIDERAGERFDAR
ncbi:MAG: ABC transporter ATP-binding protein [Thermoanaerobaculia bacterium]|nr:ABC transporter ATP-binding protein [Thermoanaerobaculia bacterium]